MDMNFLQILLTVMKSWQRALIYEPFWLHFITILWTAIILTLKHTFSVHTFFCFIIDAHKLPKILIYSWNEVNQEGEGLVQVSLLKGKGRCASKHWHTHSLLGYSSIDTAPLDIDQVLPSCCLHTCLLSATWLRNLKALINLGCSFPFKTSPPLALICLHCIWSLVRLLTAPLN